MGTKAKKPRAMRSRRSGIKKAELVRKNHQIIKKFISDKVK
jgi:hypothetical protein